MAVRALLERTKTHLSCHSHLSPLFSVAHCLHSSQPDPSPPPVDPAASYVLSEVCRVLSDFRAPHHDLDAALRPFAPSLSPSVAEHVLRRCHHLPGPAHRFFLFAAALPGFAPSALAHRLLLSTLGAARLFPLAWAHLSDLRDRDARLLHPDLFRLLFRAYARAGLPSDAVRAFNKMPDFGLRPGLDDLHHLFSSLCRHGFVAEAHAFFDQSKARFAVDPKTYSILMNGWAKPGNSKEALKLFDEMVRRGCSVDAASYNALIASLCRAGEADEAHARLQEMQRDRGLEPNAATYAAFIRAACNAKDVHSTVKVLDRMRRCGLAPNVFTYNAVIKLLCEKEKVEEAYDLLDEMLMRGAEPDVWTYNTILATHCRLHEVNKALRLLARMDKHSCPPARGTYNMLLKMLIGVGRMDRAMEVWDGMEGRGFYPSASTFAVMIHGLCRKKGRAEEACRYFEMMVDEGIPPYLSTCELLRDKLWQLGLRDKIRVLEDKMRRSTSRTIQELSSAMVRSRRMVRELDQIEY